MSAARTVRVETRKWPASPHWEFDAVRLGADGHGQWVGVTRGTWLSRPGAGFHAQCPQVVLVPHDDWWVATFYGSDPERPVDIYVDIATPAESLDDGARIRVIDLDLDVIKGTAGRLWVDDEDEFAEHQRSLGYPAEVVEQALQSCDAVLATMNARTGAFEPSVAAGWLSRLRTLTED